MNLTDAIWKGDPKALVEAKKKEQELMETGGFIGAHSLMLSTYISLFPSQSGVRKVTFFFEAWKHARVMKRMGPHLSHNQLDVLLSFYLSVGKKLVELHIPVGRLRSNSWYSSLRQLALQEVELAHASSDVKPHQLALAKITHFEVEKVFSGGYFLKEHVVQFVGEVLLLKERILSEPEQPQGKRQLARILRKLAEVLFPYTPARAVKILEDALVLAGESGAQDQIKKITLLSVFIKKTDGSV